MSNPHEIAEGLSEAQRRVMIQGDEICMTQHRNGFQEWDDSEHDPQTLKAVISKGLYEQPSMPPNERNEPPYMGDGVFSERRPPQFRMNWLKPTLLGREVAAILKEMG